ncbi:MAG TPA: iron-containing redox enzyme family protein [Blastocatellia bacterium]|nr:iron-containing redox enzyme family protein [Blastocatellia bacterium]
MTREIPDLAHQQFIDDLFTIMREEAFRDPFFDAVRAGEMSRAGVRAWVLQASIVVRQFTRFISAIHSNCPHRDAQQLLAENLWEEHGRGNAERDHYSLIRRLARSLGATDREIDEAVPIAETAEYIDHCMRVTRDESFIVGMTAIGIGIEYYMPVFFGSLAEALCSRYGVERADAEYLLVHVGEDESHAKRSMEIVEKYADTREERDRACHALREMLRVKRRYSEAIYAHCLKAV